MCAVSTLITCCDAELSLGPSGRVAGHITHTPHPSRVLLTLKIQLKENQQDSAQVLAEMSTLASEGAAWDTKVHVEETAVAVTRDTISPTQP